MNDFLVAISQNWTSALLCVLVIILCPCLFLHFYKLKRMFDNDSQYEKRYENGSIEQKSYHRNIWDLGLFPSLSKLFFREDWKIAIASSLLILFLVLYEITKEQWFAELVKVNFGLVIGALVGKKVDEKG
jgi:hypothetical protein